MPALRNPLQKLVGDLKNAADRVKEDTHRTKDKAKDHWTDFDHRLGSTSQEGPLSYVDITIHFIGAGDLPKMDVVGSADPYFVAKLGGGLKFVYVFSSFLFRVHFLMEWNVR